MTTPLRSIIHEIFRAAGRHDMPPPLATRLVKILYLADLEWRRRHQGEPISNLSWRFLHFGPYATELAEVLGGPETEVEELKGGKTARKLDLKISAATPPVPPEMSTLIEDLVTKWGDADLNTLLDYVYFDTEPMENAVRGESLKFTNLAPPERDVQLKIDPHKLKALRTQLQSQVKRLGLSRTGLHIPYVDIESERAWDDDQVSIPIPPGSTIQF